MADREDFPAGTIIVQTNNLAKYTQFHISLMETQIPVNTTIRYSTTGNINDDLVQSQGEWAWFLNDDVTWEPDALLKLLEAEKDIISPLVFDDTSPFAALSYESINEEGKYVPVNLAKHQPGLVEVVASSFDGLLVKKNVFLDVLHPWFEIGKISSQDSTEDLFFCQKARREGYKIYMDTEVCMGKTTTTTIFPVYIPEANVWAVKVDLNGTGLVIPKDKIE